MWKINATSEYLQWFNSLPEDSQVVLLAKVKILADIGPQLGRPHADTVRGSKLTNLKELRASTHAQVLRVLFYFDHTRQALLLIGGDKKGLRGRQEADFYSCLIRDAEALIETHGSKE